MCVTATVQYGRVCSCWQESQSDLEIDPLDCEESALTDWRTDCQGQPCMREAHFQSCWFQLADLHIDGLEPEQYVKYIEQLVRRVRSVPAH